MLGCNKQILCAQRDLQISSQSQEARPVLRRDVASLDPREDRGGGHTQPTGYCPLAAEALEDFAMRRHPQELRKLSVACQRRMRAERASQMSYRRVASSDGGRKPAGPSKAALNLKRLRGLASLSLADMAKELGMSTSGYQHYEVRFKKAKLPKDFAARVYGILKERGVPEADLASLGIVQQVHDDVTRLHDDVRELRRMVELLLKKSGITNE
jgi:transcriptional regulator with XRE-family HTH domain